MIEINEWLSISEISGSGDKEITISATSHKELSERIKSLKFKAEENQVFVNITQKAFVPIFNIDNVPSFSQDILERTTTITSNIPWTAVHSAEWIHLSQTSGEEGTTNLTITVDDIESTSDNRSGVIDFYYNGKVISSLIIAQEFNIVFEVPERIDITYGAEIDITSNIEWSAVTYDTFYTFNPSSGSNGTTKIIFKPNVEESLSGIINFYGMDNLLKTVEVYITSKNVEEPSDVVDCFYIEPIEGITKISLVYTNNRYDNVLYYENSEWKNLYVNEEITITKRTYLKELSGGSFGIDKPFNIGGRLETLITGLNHKWLFKDTKVVNAYNLRFPTEGRPAGGTGSNYNGEYIYESMFENCSNLIVAPKIIYVPKYNRLYTCYNMFKNCRSLTVPPMLPSTELGAGVYRHMFENCTSLANAPELPATNLAVDCYEYMFYGCSSLVNAPAILPATTLAKECYYSMFYGCSSLVNAPELPATTLANWCYNSMFHGCSSLVNAPVLPATNLVVRCYEDMFIYCYKLNNITMLATDIDASDCLYNWLYSVSSTGTFTKKQGVEIPSGHSGIPKGWTVVEVP